jgi:hypothetical protein
VFLEPWPLCRYPVSISIYLSTAIRLTPGGSTHLHTNNTQNNTINNKTTRITNKTTQITNLEECWPRPVFANYTLAFALQLREKHGKTSVRVAEEIQSIHTQDTHTLENNLKPPPVCTSYKLVSVEMQLHD